MTHRPAPTSVRLVGAAVATVLVAACGSSQTGRAGYSAPASSGSSTPGAALGVRTTALGAVLVNGKGRTLYLLTADAPRHSSCSAQCLQYWPLAAAPTSGAPSSVAGVSAKIGTTKATDGRLMLTADDKPLCAPTGRDRWLVTPVRSAGNTWGAGYSAGPPGGPIKAARSSTPTSPSSGYQQGGGYY